MIEFGLAVSQAVLAQQAQQGRSGLGNALNGGLGQAAMDANSHGQALSQYYANCRLGFGGGIPYSGLTTIERMELDLKCWLADWDKPAVPRETEG